MTPLGCFSSLLKDVHQHLVWRLRVAAAVLSLTRFIDAC
jgi:hypothetical protein